VEDGLVGDEGGMVPEGGWWVGVVVVGWVILRG
jgi:hypothetical protein